MRRIIDYVQKNPRVLFFLYLPVYLTWFALLERFVRTGYYVSYMLLDDLIPFVPAFVLVYVLWYPYLAVPAAYLYFRDAKAFVRFGVYFMISFSVSLLVCTVFPNGQDLRPADPGNGFFPWLLGRLYAADTNTNVLPSMHVVGCAGIIFAAFDSPRLKKARFPLLALGLLIAISTVMVKQHSLLDIIWGIAVAVAAALPAYARRLTGIGTNRPKRAS
jgi:membrane-associated phospholipid phosphatase